MRYIGLRHIGLLLVLVGLVSTFVTADIFSPELQQKLSQTNQSQKIPVVIHFKNSPSYEQIAQEYRFLGEQELIKDQVIRVMKDQAERNHHWLKQVCQSSSLDAQVEDFSSLWIINAVSLKATAFALRQISNQPDIEKIVIDEPVPMLLEREMTYGLKKINAPSAWAYHKGKGTVVAVIDTGVNEHSDLQGRLQDGKNYVSPGSPPRDDHSHGTHCAGTVAGNGTGGTQTGVAPQATILAVKVLAANGSGSWSNVWKSIEESVESNAKVISLSLGGRADATTRKRLREACQNAIAAGVIPVIAAGNSGSSAKTVISPGDALEVITVGATDRNDNIASFSSRGPVNWDGQEIVKPDVSAPGVGVKSCSHTSNGYRNMSGTSMATPHVAGLVALMAQANPNLNCDQAKSILEKTAADKGQKGKDNNFGSGRVDALLAVKSTQQLNLMDNGRWETVVKEIAFEVTVDANGNLDITKTVDNDAVPGIVTIWVDVKEETGQLGVYSVDFSLTTPNGGKKGSVEINYDSKPKDPNKYDAKYGFNVGNFQMETGESTGKIISNQPNPKVKNLKITIIGKATWPARPENK